MNAKFHIPDFWKHRELNLRLIDKLKKHPEYFYDGVEIASCYGCFPPALWNGGRGVFGSISPTEISATIKQFNERGVPIRYTFTNPTLTEADMKDAFCNRLCRVAQNGFNEIIVNTPAVEAYVRKVYPKYPLISSTVKQIEGIDGLLAELEKDYKLVVLDYNWNNDFEKLEQIPRELRSRCEILIDPYCMPHCPRRGEHYRVLGEAQRSVSRTANYMGKGQEIPQECREFRCINTTYNFYEIQRYRTFVKLEDIYGTYLRMGFCNFKIEGRVIQRENVLESYMYYMVKPEYRDRVRLEILTERTPLSAPARKPQGLINPDGTPVAEPADKSGE
ncbi:MAG: hypothetical protein ACI4KM_06965 [Oscillospiraceae bacterium]